MSPVLRKVLSWLCAALALVAATAWVTLSVGRPFYYTDGERLVNAFELQNASMLALGRPEPVVEVPGVVRGRVVRLPDGRLLYGRALGEFDTDLVIWDPKRRDLAPEPVAGLRTRSHELAPCLASDGMLYFASDREGGLGGFDLWRASWRDGRAGVVEHLPDGVNTAFDEVDPTVDPLAQVLVFARRDDAKGARLFTSALAELATTAPLFGDADDPRRNGSAPGRTVLDREPCFTEEGASLWFVRETEGEPPRLLRAARLQRTWAAPLEAPSLAGFHAPLADERALWLLGEPQGSEGVPALLYRVRQEEVLPWRAGQEKLEIVLLSLCAAALLALVLLQLGKRFTKLDTITICLLASLFVHIVMLVWLGRMEIVARRAPVADGGGGQLEVTVISALEGDAAALLSGGEAGSGLVDATRMERHRAELGGEAPGSAVTEIGAAGAARPSDLAGEVETSRAQVQASALRDAAALEESARKAGRDAERVVEAARGEALPEPVRAAGVRAARAAFAGDERREVVLAPATEVAGLGAEAAREAAGHRGERPSSLPEEAFAPVLRSAAPAAAPLRDAAVVASPRGGEGRDAAPGREVRPSLPDAAEASGVSTAPQRVPREARPGASRGAEALVTPASELAAAPTRAARALPDEPLGGAAGAVAQPGVALRDRVEATAPDAARPRVGAAAAPAALEPRPHEAAVSERRADVAGGALAPTRGAGRSGLGTERVEAPASDLLAGVRSERRRLDMGDSEAAPRGRAVPQAGLRDRRNADAGTRLPGPEPTKGSAVAAIVPAAWRHEAQSAVGSLALSPQRLPFEVGTAALAPPRPPNSFLDVAPLPARGEVASEPVDVSLYQNRFGPQRAAALERFGGTAETEAAVQSGLRYLAKIQQADGSFGARKRDDEKYGDVRVGKSGLCLLAFLGAGHTQVGDTAHSETVARTLHWILQQQDARTGHFGRGSAYDHGICTYAVAECYGMTKDARLREPLERALAWIVQKQNRTKDARNEGGWGYFSPAIQPEDRYSRTSITVWMVMALESAKLAGVPIDEKVLPRARENLLRSFDAENGYFLYNKEPGRLASSWRTLPASTPGAVFALFLMGVGGDDYRMRAGLEYTLDRKPSEYRRADSEDFVLRAQSHVYFWYYGSLASFLAGGTLWQDWNEALKRVLLPAQSKDGSFAPVDVYAEEAGDTNRDRAYTTAMCVLCLEVYYRYFTPLLRGK